jgi:hypothetical protein
MSSVIGPFSSLNSHVWFHGHLTHPTPKVVTTGAAPAAGGKSVDAILNGLPKQGRLGIPAPEPAPGKLNPLYSMSNDTPEGAIGLSFDFDLTHDASGYYSLAARVTRVWIPVKNGDADAIAYSKVALAKLGDHESLHTRIAVLVGHHVQATPEFQREGPAALRQTARDIESYVNSLADVRTRHGKKFIASLIWEHADQGRIIRAIERAIKLRLKNAKRFGRRQRWLDWRSENVLNPKVFTYDVNDFIPDSPEIEGVQNLQDEL